FHYDAYTFTNSTGGPACVTVDLNTTCTGTNFIFSAAYLGTFDPANICTNWLADSGLSPNPTRSYSFTVPAGARFVINVHEVTSIQDSRERRGLDADKSNHSHVP